MTRLEDLHPNAVHSSLVEPLPRQPLRFLLADDPGAGKTIMAGLLIKELIARGDIERVLIVCPDSFEHFRRRFVGGVLRDEFAPNVRPGRRICYCRQRFSVPKQRRFRLRLSLPSESRMSSTFQRPSSCTTTTVSVQSYISVSRS